MNEPSTDSRLDLAILVNSTDRYSDTWQPFFTLLGRYWPECPYPIVLNTETLDFEHPGLEIHASHTWPDRTLPRPDWSASLQRCLAA